VNHSLAARRLMAAENCGSGVVVNSQQQGFRGYAFAGSVLLHDAPKKRFHSLNALAVKSCFVLGMFSRVASCHQPATAPCTCFNASLAFALRLIA
jgi:hypothetical protein